MAYKQALRLLARIPRHLREQQAHAAPIGNAGKDEACTNKSGETDEVGMNEVSEQDPGKHERSGGDADLALKTDHFHHTSIDGQASLNPGQGPAFNDYGILKTLPRQFFGGFSGATAGPTEEVDGTILRQPASGKKTLRIESIKRFVLRLGDMDLGEFHRGADVEQGQTRFGIEQAFEVIRRNRFHARGEQAWFQAFLS